MERLESLGVRERDDIGDEIGRAEPVARVPARAGVTSRVGRVRSERGREHRQQAEEVAAPAAGRAVEQDERRALSSHLVGDGQAVGGDGRHDRVDATT